MGAVVPMFVGSFSSITVGTAEFKESSVGAVVGIPKASERVGDKLLSASACVGIGEEVGEEVLEVVGAPPTVLEASSAAP